jgi:hypothetical protein
LHLGRTDIADPGAPIADYGRAESALGPSDLNDPGNQPVIGTPGLLPVVSLGDGGSITLAFFPPIADGPGPDFAVFENGFLPTFLELAFVEVSSDGIDFTRFPAASLTPTGTQVTLATAGGLDASNLRNLAGKHRGGYGTPFDLADLAGTPDLDPAAITHVRIVDVVGSIDPLFGTRDAQDRLVNDPYPTDYETGGFDLDAVGVLHQAPGTFAHWAASVPWTGTPAHPDADADNDGAPNLVEYAFATDPLDPARLPLIGLALDGSSWTATFPEPRPGAADVVCGVEMTGDLASWAYRDGLAPLVLGEPAASRQRYCRLRVRLAPPP